MKLPSISHYWAYTLRRLQFKKTHVDACTAFIVTLFTISKTSKQPRWLSTDEQIKNMWCIYTMGHYIAIKRKGFKSVVVRQLNLETVIQSGVSQKEKNKYHILTHMYVIQKNTTNEIICRERMEIQMQRRDLLIEQEKEGLDELRKQH